MAEAATSNPNVAVGNESGPLISKTNSIMSFNDIDDADLPPPGAAPKPAPKKPSGEVPKKKDEPKKSTEKKGPADVDEDDGDEADAGAEPEEKPAKKDGDAKADAEKPKPDAKPKSHKGRSGENQLTVPSDTVFAVPVDGKKEDVSFQELVDDFSGRTNWHRKHGELAKDKKQHAEAVKALDGNVKKLYEAAQKDPEEAWDWLADLSGKDPVEMKEGMLKAQMSQAMTLLQEIGVALPADIDARLERVYNDQRLSWRERKLTRGEKHKEREVQETAASQRTAQVKERYGIDDERYETTQAEVKKFLEKNGRGDEEITPEMIVEADRSFLATRAIRKVAPHLAEREDFGQIVNETIRDLIENPTRTEEQLCATLTEVFGGNDEDANRQRRLSQKARQRQDQVPRSAEAARNAKPLMSFEEIDD